MTSETLKVQCEQELQKHLLRRMKKLAFLFRNRDRLKHLFKRVNPIPVLLPMTRLTKREERMSDAQFDCLDFEISEGGVKAKLNTKRLVKRLIWQQDSK